MSVQLAETVDHVDAHPVTGTRTMKFTFPPESKPLGGYTIKHAIHRGGFGEVYYALSDSGKEVALKLLRHNLQVELRGVKQCLNLKHPNLVTIFNVQTDDDGDHWIVMEYVSGKNLANVVDDADGGPMPVADVKKWLSGMTAGLGYLHDRGIVHRDLKPANVFEEAGVVKIGDVGLSKFITESRRSAQTESVGTVYYMAPEVAHGRYGREVDIYSLGIVLYEMLTGRVPFDGESTAEILMKHLTEKPDLTPIPERLRPVLARALEKDPLRRTPTVEQLEKEFHLALNGVQIPTDIPEESFAGGNGRRDHRPRPKDLEREARKASAAAAKAARHEYKAARKRRRARQHAERAAQITAFRDERRAMKTASSALQRRGDQSSPFSQAVKIAAVVLVLTALFAPSAAFASLKLIFVGGIVAAFAYGGSRLFAMMTAPINTDAEGNEVRTILPQHVRYLTPETLRTVPLRSRAADLTATMTYAVLVTALVTAVVCFALPQLFAQNDVGHIALFGITTLLGAWAVVVPSKLWEGTAVQSHVRRLAMVGAGAAVGLAGYWLHQTLLADTQYGFWGDGYHASALFDAAGSRSLIGSGYQPSLAGYMVFFGALFGVRRWWRHTDAFRKKRFRVATLLLTAVAGAVLPLIFAFPQMWGLMWAVAISVVVQLSSVWATHEDRRKLLEERIDV